MLQKIGNFLRQISFESVQLPGKVKSFAHRIILFTILSTMIPDILAFALKGAQISLEKGFPVLAGILLLVHFGQRALMSLFEMYYDLQEDNYKRLSTSESTKKILLIANVSKSKVFKEQNGIIQMVEHPEIIKIAKDYLEAYWNFYLRFPSILTQIVTLSTVLLISILLELQTSTLAETAMTTTILVTGIIFYFRFCNKRIHAMCEYRTVRKKYEKECDVLTTEIKMTEFISQADFAYHAEKLRDKLDENIQVQKEERLKLNKVFIYMSVTASIMIISIMLVKFRFSEILTLKTFVDVITFSSICSTMLYRISSITNSYEKIMDYVIDINTLYEDFKRINDVYETEKQKTLIRTPIESLSVTQFSVSKDPNGTFALINETAFKLFSNDCVMAYGRTGSGKSTLIQLFTGKMNLLSSPISFSNGKTGYLNSIGYQTDKAMVNNFVLNEITLTDNLETIDKEKLLFIIKGLKLYEEILRMIHAEKISLTASTDTEKIFEFLQKRKTREFSSGQMQRLALAKLLYTLDSSIQLVALDEPFNRLDDNTCKECMEFIKNYVLRDKKRILFLATHQAQICKQFANVEISFGEDLEKSIIQVIRK